MLELFRDLRDVLDERVAISHFVVVPREDFHQSSVHHARHCEIGDRAEWLAQNVRGYKRLFGNGKPPLPPVARGSALQGIVYFFYRGRPLRDECDIDDRTGGDWNPHCDAVELSLQMRKRERRRLRRASRGRSEICGSRSSATEIVRRRAVDNRLRGGVCVRRVENRALAADSFVE